MWLLPGGPGGQRARYAEEEADDAADHEGGRSDHGREGEHGDRIGGDPVQEEDGRAHEPQRRKRAADIGEMAGFGSFSA